MATLTLNGDSSGSINLTVPSAAGTNTITLPASTGTVVLQPSTTNTAFGASALAANTTGVQNTAIGSSALSSNTSGNNNTSVGQGALTTNTTASGNVALGVSSLYNNLSGANNTALGFQTLFTNSTGQGNVAIGQGALYYNTASFNVAVGQTSLFNNSTGNELTAVGYNALNANTTGTECVAVGDFALAGSNTYGNTAIGSESQRYTTGQRNTACGLYTLVQATGDQNTAVGAFSMQNVTSGANNHCFGYNSGSDGLINLTTQSNYVVLGNSGTQFLYCKTSTISTSDIRDKIIEGPVPHGLDFINQVSPISYKFKKSREDSVPQENEPLRYGFSAQEILALEGSSKSIIIDDNPDRLAMNTTHLIPVLVNALKELSAKNDALEARIAALEAK